MIFKPTNQRPVSDDDEYDEQNFSISVEDSVIEIKLNNPLLKDGASVVVSPSCSVFDCQEFLDYMTSTCLPFIIYAIEHDSLTDQVRFYTSRESEQTADIGCTTLDCIIWSLVDSHESATFGFRFDLIDCNTSHVKSYVSVAV